MDSNAALRRFRAVARRARSFRGWDPGAVAPSLVAAPPPWHYEDQARKALARSSSALDMGTGGGEILSALAPHPPFTVATEGWPPNVPVAAARLRPLGVHVVAADSLVLPFQDAVFDLVLDRHEELEPSETARVLAPGGKLITQQVGEQNWAELDRYFPRRQQSAGLYQSYVSGLSNAGLSIETADRHVYPAAYRGIDDIVYMLTIAPWTVPEFDVERDLSALLALERDCTTSEGLVLTEARFLIVAGKQVSPRPP